MVVFGFSVSFVFLYEMTDKRNGCVNNDISIGRPQGFFSFLLVFSFDIKRLSYHEVNVTGQHVEKLNI